MAKRLQLRRGTTAEHSTFTGSVGEVTVDTDKDAVVVHDGVTAGGVPVATESALTTHTSDTDNPHSVTYTQVGADAAGTAASSMTTHETTYDHDAFLSDSDIGVNVEAYDSTILKDADIGVTVEAYDSTILKDADIGVTVEAYDSTILKDADIGVNVQAYDANIVSDASYVHTDNNYDDDAVSKLGGIEAGAEVNVNADWDAVSGDAQILNKPTTISGYGITDAYTETEVDNLLDDKVDLVTGVDNVVVRFDGTTGAIQTSAVTIDDTGNVQASSLSLGSEGVADGYLNTQESLYINIDSDNTDTTKIVQIGRDTTGQSTEPIAIFRENGDFILHDDTGASELVLWDASEEKLTVTGDIDAGNVTLTGYLAGPATFTIDPSAVGDNTGTVVIAGNLQVDGTTTTVNSQTLDVADLNITVASGATTAAEANGAGLTIDGAAATLLYTSATDSFGFNKDLSISGDVSVTGTVDGRDVATDGTALDNHTASTSNPHSVDYTQTGGVGAVTSTNNAVVRFNGTSGQVQNSSVTIDDSGNVSVVGSVSISDTLYAENIVTTSTGIYLLGQPGELGFGCATATQEQYQAAGCIPLVGHDSIGHDNYGNYLHLASGAVMVWIPKHYFKIAGNAFSYAEEATTGYVLDRSFINAGSEIDGIMVGKYVGTNSNGMFSSQPGQDPLSTNSAHNPISNLNGTPANNYGGLYAAVKTMDANAVLTPVFVYAMLARMAKAHGEASTSTSICAYIDVNPKMPKGCLVSALHDVNDSSVTYTGSGYSACGLTGSGTPFAKTTHNGQACGIADLNGNMWEVASGFIRMDATGFLILKESADLTAIASDSTTQGGGGAYDIDLYDVIDISDIVSANDGWTYLGNSSNQVFGFSTTRTDAAYKRTALGIALAAGVSGSGTTEFGNDGLYRYLRNEMACRCGGSWGDSSNAGVFAGRLDDTRTDSAHSVGGRASILV